MVIIHLHDTCTEEGASSLCDDLVARGIEHNRTSANGIQLLILNEAFISPLLLAELGKHPLVKAVEPTGSLPTLTLRKEDERGVRPLSIRGQVIDFSDPCILAGPCVVESESVLDEIASHLRSLGVGILRGGGEKIRSSPHSFRGLGAKGYETLCRVAEKYKMLTVAEVVESDLLNETAKILDILQVGARNMHNPHFLEKVGSFEKPVLLKRGFGATYEEWLWASEYLLGAGASSIIFCERGIRTFSPMRRYTLDIHAIPFLREMTPFPVIGDPSHAAGYSPFVADLGRACLAAGAHGLLVECHPEPARARCDARQALTLSGMDDLLHSVSPVIPQTADPSNPLTATNENSVEPHPPISIQ